MCIAFQTRKTHPGHDAKHGDLVHCVKAEKYGIPLHIRQCRYRVQVRRPRGVLQLNRGRLRVVNPVVLVHLVASSVDRRRLFDAPS